MGVLAGLIGGLGIAGTSEAFIEGFRSMTYAALLVGFARAISIAMQEGLIIDTVVHGLSIPLATLPVGVAAVGMMAVQAAIHVGVPSVSGQAVLTIPVFAPLADLVGMTRQVAVLAYQYGAGLCELLTPTNGGLLAVLAAASVRFEDYIRVIARLVRPRSARRAYSSRSRSTCNSRQGGGLYVLHWRPAPGFDGRRIQGWTHRSRMTSVPLLFTQAWPYLLSSSYCLPVPGSR